MMFLRGLRHGFLASVTYLAYLKAEDPNDDTPYSSGWLLGWLAGFLVLCAIAFTVGSYVTGLL